MKKKSVIIALVAVALLTLSVACKKSRYCHCISDNYTIVINADTVVRADTSVINVDRSMKCDYIKEVTFRTKDEGPVVYTVRKVNCNELEVDTVTVMP